MGPLISQVLNCVFKKKKKKKLLKEQMAMNACSVELHEPGQILSL